MPIQQEIKQTRPFSTKSEEAAVALLRTADLLRRNLAAVIEPIGITVQQYNVLRILRGAGAAGLPTLEIAERMLEQTPGITRLIDRLEVKKLVTRVRCLSDRRQVFCHIAPAGLKVLETLVDSIRDANATTVGMLSARELSQLLGLLDRTRSKLTAALEAQRTVVAHSQGGVHEEVVGRPRRRSRPQRRIGVRRA